MSDSLLHNAIAMSLFEQFVVSALLLLSSPQLL